MNIIYDQPATADQLRELKASALFHRRLSDLTLAMIKAAEADDASAMAVAVAELESMEGESELPGQN